MISPPVVLGEEDVAPAADGLRGVLHGGPPASRPKWTQEQAIELCRKIETFAPKYGCHVALTGGTLYHFGERKDADILFYRIRQAESINVDGLMVALREIGVTPGPDHGWCYKATYEGRAIDFFFPEREGMEYPGRDDESFSDDDIARLTSLLDKASEGLNAGPPRPKAEHNYPESPLPISRGGK